MHGREKKIKKKRPGGRSIRGTRKIVVNDIEYRWWADPGNNITVFKAGVASNKGQDLYFHAPWGQNSGGCGWGCPYCGPEPVAITPKDVQHAILFAIHKGWDPEKSDEYKFAIRGFIDEFMSRESFHEMVQNLVVSA